MRNTFKKGGIHPEAHKEASRGIELLKLPGKAVVPLSQHIGAPARPVVSKGDKVRRGMLIAENSAFVSAGLHAPISGTVTGIVPVALPWGKSTQAIVIEADEEEHRADTESRQEYWASMIPGESDRLLSERLSSEEIRRKVSEAGIVGLGGATFPSHVKLDVKAEAHPEILIINGCECEPYLMCDDVLMCAYPGRIVEGVELMMKAAGIGKAVIAVEDNKPEAAASLSAALDSAHDISVRVLKTKYPQGGEKQLVEAVTGRRIGSGKLPASIGAVVHNIATAFAVWQAVAAGQPLIERVITITGDINPQERKNYIAAIGTPFNEMPFTLPASPKIVVGGPMMGRAAVRLDAPVMKGTSGLTVLDAGVKPNVRACVRCGACVDACPMGLEPYLISTYGRLRMWDDAYAAGVSDCLECGACSYSCPSYRPILDYIRVAKQRCKR